MTSSLPALRRHAPYAVMLLGALALNLSLGGPGGLGTIRDALPDRDLTVPLAVSFGLLLGGYAAMLASGRQPRRRALAIYGGLLLGLFLLTPCALSIDVLDYIRRGRVLAVHHANPHTVPPGNFPADPFYDATGWYFLPTPYGPVFTVASSVLCALAGNGVVANVLAFKLAMAVSHAANAVLIGALTSSTALLLAYFYNPFILVEGVGTAHNDVLAMLPVLASLLLLRRGRPVLAAAALALAANVKAPLVVLLPLWAWYVLRGRDLTGSRSRGATVLLGCSAFALLTAALWFPFYAGPRTFAVHRAAAGLRTKWSFPRLLQGVLARIAGPSTLTSRTFTAAGGALAAAGLGTAVVLPATSWRRYVRAVAVVLFAVPALAMGWVFPWYFIWAVTVFLAVPERLYRGAAFALTAGCLAHYVQLTRLGFASSFGENLLLGATTTGPAVLVLAAGLLWRRGRAPDAGSASKWG